MQRFVILVCALAATAMVDAKREFPTFIKICSRKNIDACFLENIEIVKPYLKKGVPRLGLPTFDPFYIPQISMDNNNLKVTLDNMKVSHADEATFADMKVDLDNNKISTIVKFPRLEIDSDYVMYGKILILELNGKGKAFCNMTNFNVDLVLTGERFQKDGAEHINFTKKEINLRYEGDLYLYFSNLFGDREDLTANTNAVINEASKDFIKELEPIVKSAVEAMIETSMNNVYLKFPLNELFTD